MSNVLRKGSDQLKFEDPWRIFKIMAELVSGFDAAHPFWRNGVSSKMQEWEGSISYFAVILFSLNQIKQDTTIVLVVENNAQWNICKEWADVYNWDIQDINSTRRGFVIIISEECKNILYFVRIVFKSIFRKIYSPKFRSLNMESGSRKNVLIASLFYPCSIKGDKYQDPFFGDIHEYLDNNNINCMYLCDYLAEPDKEMAKSIILQNNVSINVPYGVLSWRELGKELFNVFVTRIKIKPVRFMKCDFSELIKWNLRRFSNAFTVNAQIYFA